MSFTIPFSYMGGTLDPDLNGNDANTLYLYHGNTLANQAYAPPPSTTLSQVGTYATVNNTDYKKFTAYGVLKNTYYTSNFNTPCTSSNFNINSDFTIDFWFLHTASYQGGRELVSLQGSGLESIGISNTQTSISLKGQDSSWTYVINGSGTVANTPNVWHHIAVVRKGTSTRLYFDGVSVISLTSKTVYTGHNSLRLAQGAGYESGNHTYMAEFRMSKTARWLDNFTPPTTPYGT